MRNGGNRREHSFWGERSIRPKELYAALTASRMDGPALTGGGNQTARKVTVNLPVGIVGAD